jgi:RimJ/RimL family protein N-acetyltransferase
VSSFQYVRSGLTKDGQPFCLRPAQEADSDHIIANIRAVCAEQIYLTTGVFILTPDWEQALTNPVDVAARRLLIVAEIQGDVVGHLRLFPPWYGERGRHVAEVGILLLAPWREQGIGKALLGYAIEWAGYTKLLRLNASVFSINRRALNLFSLYNFIQEGYRPAQFLVEGQYVDEVLLGRLLQPVSNVR